MRPGRGSERLRFALRAHAPQVVKSAYHLGHHAAGLARLLTATRLRGRAYRDSDKWWLRALPDGLAARWRLALPPGVRRVEVGSGHNPLPGYLHVDAD